MSLINIYAPNSETERKSFFREIELFINTHALNKNNLILGGDFNCCLRDIDRNPPTHLTDGSRNNFKNLLQNHNLFDLWNENCIDQTCFTYTDKFRKTESRLDYILVTQTFLEKSNCTLTEPVNILFDHKMLTANFQLHPRKRGTDYWKFNSELLKDTMYCEKIKYIIKEVRQSYEDVLNKKDIWELIKVKIKEFTIVYCQNKSKQQKSEILELQKNLDLLNKNATPNRDHEIEETKIRLDALLEIQTRGAFIRSKAEWCDSGEKCNKLFLNLETKRQTSNVIEQVHDCEGNIISNDHDILIELQRFYDSLFKSSMIKTGDITNYLNTVNVSKSLSITEKMKLNHPIQKAELDIAVKKLKSGKSPGLDGLTPEFYKCFWEDLCMPFGEMVETTFETGSLPESAKIAVAQLIFKKGNSQLLKNYRPISLTNYDYKIIAFVLSERIQKVIQNLISHDQTAYIKERFIGNNVRLLSDIIHYCNLAKQNGILLSVDFEKAFDTVEWNFMYECLRKFNFGENFIKWIEVLYTDPIMVVKNNGYFTKKIRLTRGLRQGCPISALLFIIVVEILAIKIRSNDAISGLSIQDTTFKISQYADDLTLILSDLQSVSSSINTIKQFSKVAGPKLNLDKTEGLLIGNLKNSNIGEYVGISITNRLTKVLGIYIGNTQIQCEELNWNGKLNKIQNILNLWIKRNLTIFGKTVVVNTLCISKLVYNFLLIPVPEYVIKKLENMIINFLFKSRQRLNRKCLINTVENGGINLVDIRCKISALKASWICRWSNEAPWVALGNYFLQCTGCNYDMFLNMNICYSNDSILKKLPRFYKEAWLSYYSCRPKTEIQDLSPYNFLTSIIWGNKYFQFKGKCLYFKNWINAGIVYVKDLFNYEGCFLSESDLLSILPVKRNWISEYSIIKTVFSPLAKLFCTETAHYIRIPKMTLFFNGKKMVNIKHVKSTVFYNILVQNIGTRHYMEKQWNLKFKNNYQKSDWQNIYLRKIKSIPCKKIAEFNYKLLQNLLITGYILGKWNKNISSTCTYCNENDTPEHLLFCCNRTKRIWEDISYALKLKLTYKHLALGLDEDGMQNINTARNNVISVIAYGIYCTWVKCEDSKQSYKYISLNQSVKHYIYHYNCIFQA